MRYVLNSRAQVSGLAIVVCGLASWASPAHAGFSTYAAVLITSGVIQGSTERDEPQDEMAQQDAPSDSAADHDGIQPRADSIEPRDFYIEPRTYWIEPRQYYIEPRTYWIEPRQVILEPRQALIEPRYPEIVPRSFQPRFAQTRSLHIPLHYKYPPLSPLPEEDPEFEEDMLLEEEAAKRAA